MRRAAVLIPFALPGCAVFEKGPVIENRFASVRSLNGRDDSVRIAVSSSAVTSVDGGIALNLLSDRGQAAMIEQTKGKPPTLLKPAAPSSTVTVRNSLSRHLVIAIQPKRFLAPGDRVDAIRVSLRIDGSQGPRSWKIASWTQASNGQTVIDLGKLTDTSSSKATFSAGLNIAPALPSATVGGEVGRTKVRETEIRDMTDFDASVDNMGVARLYETAGSRQSLAHNLAVDVVLTSIAPLSPSGVMSVGDLVQTDAKGVQSAAKASAVRLRHGEIYAPISDEQRPVCGRADLDYRIRHIVDRSSGHFVGGPETLLESDDVVEFRSGRHSTYFLMSPPPYTPNYVVRTGAHPLQYREGTAPAKSLTFATVEEATNFRDWLRETAPRGGRLAPPFGIGFSFGPVFRPLTGAEYGQLEVEPENGYEKPDPALATACQGTPATERARPTSSGEGRRSRPTP